MRPMTSRSGHRQRSLNGRHEYAPTALAVLGHSCGQDADSDRKVPSPSIKINRAAASGLNWRPILWVPHARMTGRNIGRQPRRTPSATFTVKEIADRLSAGLIRFDHSLAFVSVHAALGYCVSFFGGAALWTSVGETRFIRFQLELFRADSADFDRKHHSVHDMTLTS